MDENYQSKIAELTNKSEITDVVNSYFKALDEKHFDPRHFATILTQDATVVRPNGEALVGPEEASASHQHSFERFESSQHLLTGHEISVNGATATLRANLVAMHMWLGSRTNANDINNFFVAGGVIHATLVQDGDGWKISQLSNDVTWRAGGFKNMAETK
jgi:ketosteroid isomerase-like protein